jgi:hypothetical protein
MLVLTVSSMGFEYGCCMVAVSKHTQTIQQPYMNLTL